MKTCFSSILVLLCCIAPLAAQGPAAATPKATPAPKKFELYAQFLEETKVELSDGAIWQMDKGDCFPIYMFKENQTKVVLQLASATFTTPAAGIRVMNDSEKEMALASYRRNLSTYLNGRPDVWKADAVKKKKADAPAKPKGPTPITPATPVRDAAPKE